MKNKKKEQEEEKPRRKNSKKKKEKEKYQYCYFGKMICPAHDKTNVLGRDDCTAAILHTLKIYLP